MGRQIAPYWGSRGADCVFTHSGGTLQNSEHQLTVTTGDGGTWGPKTVEGLDNLDSLSALAFVTPGAPLLSLPTLTLSALMLPLPQVFASSSCYLEYPYP